MRVRATQMGYWGHKRRKEGDVFELKTIKGKKIIVDRDAEGKKISEKLVPHTFSPEEQFSEKWMEKVSAKIPVGPAPVMPKKPGRPAIDDEVDGDTGGDEEVI